jgi:hypothetical protein
MKGSDGLPLLTTTQIGEVVQICPQQSGPCEVHDWPTEGLPKRLVEAMRARYGKGGLNVCIECLVRARDEARERAGL